MIKKSTFSIYDLALHRKQISKNVNFLVKYVNTEPRILILIITLAHSFMDRF